MIIREGVRILKLCILMLLFVFSFLIIFLPSAMNYLLLSRESFLSFNNGLSSLCPQELKLRFKEDRVLISQGLSDVYMIHTVQSVAETRSGIDARGISFYATSVR